MPNISTTIIDIKKTTIVHISPSYKPAYIYGGTIASVSKLCETLSAHQCDVKVLTTTANGMKELDVRRNKAILTDGVEVRYCRRLSKDPTHLSISLLWQLYCIISKKPSVIVHIHSWWNFSAVLSLLMCRLLRVPAILSPRGMLTEYSLLHSKPMLKKYFHRWVGRWLLQYPQLHATSVKERDDILERFSYQKNIAVIPNMIQLPKIANYDPVRCQNNCFRLLFLSRIQHKKGLELLFKALKNLHFSWQLSIGGTGEPAYIKELKELARRCAIDKSVHWMGHISNEQKYHCLASHDLLVLPSYNENFGNVVLEALLSGTPVLISKAVGLSGYIKKRGLGWVTELDRRSLVMSLNKAYQQEEKRIYIRKIAATNVRNDFDEKQLLYEYLQLYNKVIQS